MHLVSDGGVRTLLIPLPKKPRRLTVRRRAQCRANQARYRAKKRARTHALETAVTHLHASISALLTRREQLARRLERHDTARHVVTTLYDEFRHGLTHDEHRPLQVALLTTLYHYGVRVGGERGRAAVVQQWCRFSEFWGDFTITLEHLECVATGEDDVTVRGRLCLEITITAATIRYVFPHLMAPHNHDLFQKLIDRRLRALLAYLSMSDVARVLERARIERDAYLMEPYGLAKEW